MKILRFLAALCFGAAVASVAGDGKVTSIDIYVTPYYSANAGKAEHVKVYDKIDGLLKSGTLEDFKSAKKIVQDAPQMVTPMTLFVLSARAYDLGLRDDAVFWFYNAKNRAILLREIINLDDGRFFEVKSAIGAFIKLVGDVVNPYAFCDLAKQLPLKFAQKAVYLKINLAKFPHESAV